MAKLTKKLRDECARALRFPGMLSTIMMFELADALAACEVEAEGHRTEVVLGNAVGLRLYRVDDGDGEMFVVARDFTDAIARWRKQLHVENPGDETRTDWEPDSVVHLCGGGDLLLPRVAEREVGHV